MADAKWISGLTSSTPVCVAARRALSVRLRSVQERIRPAVKEAEKDIEHVHRLRVATRRARAAVDLFADSLPDDVYKRLRKHLRRLRRAAGAARDCDVFLTMVEERVKRAAARDVAGLHWLAGQASAARSLAQTELVEVCKTYGPDFDRVVKDAVQALQRHGSEAPLVEVARPELSTLLESLERAAAGDVTDYDQLHEVRICGKRLRYAMEIFAGCFAGDFRKSLYPLVNEMQEILGSANDSHVAAQRLAEMREQAQTSWPSLWRAWKPGAGKLLHFHERQLVAKRQEFLRFWARWQKSNLRAQFLASIGAAGSV